MKKKTLLSFILLSYLLWGFTLNAQIKLPAIVSSNMVLQRNTEVVLWGWDDTNEEITIQGSWFKDPITTTPQKDGRWQIKVKTTLSKDPQSLHITSQTSEIILNNILFGEVWLCSGQSNMEMPVSGFPGQPTMGANNAIAKSNQPNLRLFSVKKTGARAPLIHLEGFTAWQAASPESVYDFSAIGYFFGQQLQEILDVPVGIIHTSWGGSLVEAWMSQECLSQYQTLTLNKKTNLAQSNRVQTALFNAMINPLIPYTIKGALWYQGEANRKSPQEYKKLFPAMVNDWRTRWGIGNFPFYYCQIAPFAYGDCNSAYIREAQQQCLDLIPNSGMAVLMDIGTKQPIHPPYKKEAANRLLYIALHQTYGYNTVDDAGPCYQSQTIQDGKIILNFKHAEKGLYTPDKLEGFEIAGKDRIFYPAEASIINKTQVMVKNNQVKDPIAVRYAWRNWIIGTLYDTSLLPASSFRTDNWQETSPLK